MSGAVSSPASHLDVLDELEARGLRLSLAGADLRLEGPQRRVDAELVGRIKAAKAELLGHLTAQEQSFALTLLQRAFLIGRGESVEVGNVASHIYHEIDGCWDLDRLETALRAVISRHGMLRTRFTTDGRQVQEPSVRAGIDRLDLRGQPAAQQQATLLALREQRSHAVLPSDRAPMLQVAVTLLPGDQMRLHIGHDGLVMDGISMFLFFADWWRAYTDPGHADAQPGAGEASFADYVSALAAMTETAPAQRSRRYWLDRLPDLPPRPALALATSPAAITRPRFTQYAARLDPRSWDAMKARAASAGLTPTGVLLAAYAETLARWGAGSRFTLTTTVAHRLPVHPRIADAIGNFAQTLLVEIDLDPRQTFQDRALSLQGRLRRDLDHRHFSGIEVLRELARRDGGADVRMPFTFNSAIGYVRADIDGSALELFGPEIYTSSQTPQVWLNAFAFEQHGGVIIQLDAVDELFPDAMIEAVAAGYQSLLDQLGTDSAWSATTFDLLSADQLERRRSANDTARPLPPELLTDAFRRHAVRTPDAPAVLTSATSVSYGELWRRACHAAAWLRARHVGRDELVGLLMGRGPEQIVGILATMLAGGAYLPIEAGLPAERMAYMLRDGQVRCVLTSLAGAQAAGTLAAGGGVETLMLDMASPASPAAGGAGPAPLPGASPDDLAYVLYTSGTTGDPKGVMISQRSVANVVGDCNDRFGMSSADRFMAISAFSFDLSVYDVFGALSAGAAIVMPDAGRAADPAHWLELCDRFGVTVWNSVPAIAGLLQEQAELDPAGRPGPVPADQSPLRALRLVMLSGDRIPPPLPAALRRIRPGVTLISLGGPTETTIWNILHPIDGADDGQSIPYGRPNANNRAYILDADGLDAPDWVTGEICAAGTGLARGYWRDEARTAARFWFDERRGERLYRTGDLGHYLPDGSIVIAGRSDFQVKINGYRIEAGEVEARLTAIPAVREAVVAAQAAAHGDRLVAHLIAAGTDRPAEEEIWQALRAHLPDYMMPAAIIWHESLPLTANGKVDRGKLAAMAPAGPSGGARSAARTGPATETEQRIIGLWAGVLRLPPQSIGRATDFYDLGGDSLAAARIFTGVRKQFGVSITLDRLHDVRTVAAMAACVDAGAGAASSSALAGGGAVTP